MSVFGPTVTTFLLIRAPTVTSVWSLPSAATLTFSRS
jgi:hypothetical protein